eukprot:COSAG06_NODE_38973_length_417_cov_1.761006_1_plen_41_part_01
MPWSSNDKSSSQRAWRAASDDGLEKDRGGQRTARTEPMKFT